MTVRPFDWRDFPALYRNRHQSTFLDSALVLTRGPLLVPGALFSYLAPSMGILTAVSRCDGHENGHLIGQVMHSVGAPYGHLDRKSTRLNSSHVRISYAVFCLKKKTK